MSHFAFSTTGPYVLRRPEDWTSICAHANLQVAIPGPAEYPAFGMIVGFGPVMRPFFVPVGTIREFLRLVDEQPTPSPTDPAAPAAPPDDPLARLAEVERQLLAIRTNLPELLALGFTNATILVSAGLAGEAEFERLQQSLIGRADEQVSKMFDPVVVRVDE